MTKPQVIFISLLVIFFISCSDGKKDISTYNVQYRNYESSIIIDGYAEPVQATSISCPRSGSRGTIAYIIEDGTWVNVGDTLCSIEQQSLQTEYDKLQIDLENGKASLEKTKADLALQYALLEAEVRNNEAETQIAHLDSSRLEYYSPNQRHIRELELQIVGISRKKIEAKLGALAIIQQSEVKRLELEIQQLSNRVQAIKKDLDDLVLLSPQKGLAVRATNPMSGNKMNIGDVVWNRMPIVNIPVMSKMKMKILASEQDYKYININDSVSYFFDALHDNIAWGKILSKMPVGRQIKEGSKVKHFDIEASIDSTLLPPSPGFIARCHITLKAVRDTIAVPQIAIFEQDSMKVVYVENKKGYEMRQVLLGESSPKEAVIIKGLQIDEKIALSRPKDSQIKERTILSDSIRVSKK